MPLNQQDIDEGVGRKTKPYKRYIAVDGLYRCRGCEGRFPAGEITRDKNRNGELQDVGNCRSCSREKNRKAKDRNPEKWKQKSVLNSLKRHYGLSADAYQAMYDGQKGLCEICGRAFASRLDPSAKRYNVLNVDHNHATGEIRGLICKGCNHGLGCFGDNPDNLQAAANYLKIRGFYTQE